MLLTFLMFPAAAGFIKLGTIIMGLTGGRGGAIPMFGNFPVIGIGYSAMVPDLSSIVGMALLGI